MKPLSLILEGFTGIEAGLRKKRIELDLSVIPDDASLVALVGPNGVGKTTILDNLHPYRVMPSKVRGHALVTPSKFTFWNELSAPVAMKVLTWQHGDRTYRSTQTFRSAGKSKSQSCFLHVQAGPDVWEAVQTAEGVASDGSGATYDHCIESVLGRCEVFLSTAFSAWKRTMLAALQPSDTKALLSLWLGADEYLKLASSASQISSQLKASQQVFQAQAREIPAREAAVSEADQKHRRGQAELVPLEAKVRDATISLESARSNLERVKLEAAGRDALDRERVVLQDSLVSLRSRAATARLAIETAGKSVRDGRLRTAAGLRQQIETADLGLTAVTNQSAALNQLLGSRDQIERDRARVSELAIEEAQVLAELARLRAEKELLYPKRREATEKALTLERLESAGRQTGNEHKKTSSVARLASEVPCAGSGLQPQCMLLKDANEASARLSELSDLLVTQRAKYRSERVLYEALGVDVKKLEQAEASEVVVLERQNRIAVELATARASASRQEQLAAAEARIAELQPRIVSLQESRAKAIAELEALGKAMEDDRLKLHEATNTAALRDNEEIAVVEAKLAKLPAVSKGQEISALQASVQDAEVVLRRVVSLLNDQRASVAAMAERVRLLRVALEELVTVQYTCDELGQEISRWELLSKGLGKDGVIAFSIDDAGPEISRIANDLLRECFGGRFVVRFETQRELQSGGLKEDFDIIVHDAQLDKPKSVSDVSGGEEVWINDSLMKAAALYLSESGRYNYETLFTDETDGPLDEERKRQYMALKRGVMKHGCFAREYFVSHTKEVQEMADYVIDVSKL